jgi:hypothetical protein
MEGSFMEIVDPLLPTQVDTQIDPITSIESDTDEEDAAPKIPSQWAKLMSLSPEVPTHDLDLTPEDEEGRQGIHRLGRSTNNCNIIFPQRRISNVHCLLYCQTRFFLFSSAALSSFLSLSLSLLVRAMGS